MGTQAYIMKHNPCTGAEERSQPHQIEKRPRMLVVRIDKGKLDFIATGKFADNSRLSRRMDSHRLGEGRKHIVQQKTDRLVPFQDAVSVSVDGVY